MEGMGRYTYACDMTPGNGVLARGIVTQHLAKLLADSSLEFRGIGACFRSNIVGVVYHGRHVFKSQASGTHV
jgi:hypothetical protein